MDWLYLMPDPWDLAGGAERERFQVLNQIIKNAHFPTGNVLELGCGEGENTAFLSQLCQNLDALDISGRAINRAKSKNIKANFFQANLIDFLKSNSRQYDLIIACEVLYYLKDIKQVLELMNQQGKNIIVTFFDGEASQMAAHFTKIKNINYQVIQGKENKWHAYWWSVK